MKELCKIISFLFVHFNYCNAQQDTVCIETARLGRIADTVAYLRQYQRYAITADSAFSECKRLSTVLMQKNDALIVQRDGAVNSAEALAYQLGIEKSLSKQWQNEATEKDLKLQKAKRSRRTWTGLFFGMAGAGVATALIISLL